MKELFMSDELTPHPIVLAIIAIAIAVLCLGGCATGGCGDCCDFGAAKVAEGTK